MRRFFFLCVVLAVCALAAPAWAAAPAIGQQPINRTVTENDPVSFFVGGVTGDAPLFFLWRRNGTIISNAPNGPVYSIPFAALADNGSGYSVIITNTSGSITSAVATLTVNADVTEPTILNVTNSPDRLHVVVIFSERVGATTANNPANYVIPGAQINSASLHPNAGSVTLTLNAAVTLGAAYSVIVDNVADVAATPNIIAAGTHFDFKAGNPPLIALQPENQAVNLGDPASFSVTATGTELEYQWYRGLFKLTDETNATLTLPSVTPALLGSYRVVVSNYLNVVTSAAATLSFFNNYAVDLPPGYSFVAKQLSNSTPQFPVPSSDMTLYKWNPALQSFAVYNFAAGAGWNPAEPVVDVGEGVIIQTVVPASLVFTGTRIVPSLPVSLSPGFNLLGAQEPKIAGYADVVGPVQEGALVYQYRPGGDITLFTETNYQNNYFIYGQWRDQPPRLRVGEAAWIRLGIPVVITNQPVALTNVTIGQTAAFTVGASGEAPIRYQWRLNGQDIPNATNASYSINAAGPTNAGLYTVAVGNVLGDLETQPVPLRLNVTNFNFADNFGTPGPVTNSNGLYRGNNTGATREAGEPLHAGKRTGASVWFHWTPVVGGIVNASLAGSGFDSVLAVYTGNSISNLYQMDADDDSDGYGAAHVRFNARVGTTYRFCIAGLGNEKGDVLFGWNLQATTQVLPEFGTQPHDTTAGQGQTVQLSAAVTNGAVSYLWFHDGAALTNNPTATNATLTISNVSDENTGRYFVRAQNQNRQRESLRAELQLIVPAPASPEEGVSTVDKFFDLDLPPAGGGAPLKKPDDKFGAVQHGYTKSAASLSVTSGARDPAEPNHCGVAGGKTYWFVVRATNNGTMYVNTDGSSYNTVLAAYIGPGDSYATLTNVACDNNSGLDGLDSRASFAATSNTLYYIAAGNVGLTSGSLTWKYQLVRPLIITNLVYTSLPGPTFRMQINGTPGLAAAVQYTTNLTSPVWFTLTNYTATNGTFSFTNNNVPSTTNRFYRVVNNL